MKIRTGFVSNSSSSSFVLYGACISTYDKDVEALIDVIKKKHDVTDDDIEADGLFEYADNVLKEPYRIKRYGDDDIVIGIHPSYFDINKTVKQSMDEIKEYTRSILGDQIPDDSYGWYEDCSYS